MAEVAAGLYAAETVAEVGIVGALALRKPTVPLHIRFRKIPPPEGRVPVQTFDPATGEQESSQTTFGCGSCSVSIVGDKAYLLGGGSSASEDGQERSIGERQGLHMVSLPSNLEMMEKSIDYSVVEIKAKRERPLATANPQPSQQNMPGFSGRHAQASTRIGNKIYYLGGTTDGSSKENPTLLVSAFDTKTCEWEDLGPQPAHSSTHPPDREFPSLTSSESPTSEADLNITPDAHGTIFLHGGSNKSSGGCLRDNWALDLASQTWTQLPYLPPIRAEEVEAEGCISFVDGRLYHIGDGFGKVNYLDFDMSGTRLTPQDHEWKTISATQPNTSASEKQTDQSTTPLLPGNSLPNPRSGAALVPITTGAGRQYLLYLLGKDGTDSTSNDLWSFQLPSARSTAARLKDATRSLVGWNSGESAWAKCEVTQSTKQDGPLELPAGRWRFGCDVWTEKGGAGLVMWGGIDAGGRDLGDGWILEVD